MFVIFNMFIFFLLLYFRENSASIQIVNDIEAEGVAYREEFLIEQEELKKVCHGKR